MKTLALAVLCNAIAPLAFAQDPCGTWSVVPTPNDPASTNTILHEMAVISPDDVWALGRKYVPVTGGNETQTLAMHWDGASWTIVPTPSPSPYVGGGWADFQAVEAVSSEDVWAAGGQRIRAPDGYVGTHLMVQRWNGSSWQIVPAPITLGGSGNFIDDIEAISADDVWFVGDWLEFPPTSAAEKRALAMRWNGGSFEIFDTPFFDNSPIGGHGLTAIHGLSSDDIWAVGGGHDGDYVGFSYIVHWDGSQWEYRPGPTAGWLHRLLDVQMVASDDVYAVGEYEDESGYYGLFLHWDGSSWTRLPDPPIVGATIEVLAPDRIYVGGNGIAVWDGASWETVATFPGVGYPVVASLEPIGPCALWGSGRRFEGSAIEPLTVRLDRNSPTGVYAFSAFGISAPNSVGPGAHIGASGTTSIAAGNLTLHARGCPPNELGFFFYGPRRAQAPLGNGWRLVGGTPLIRMPIMSTSSTGFAAQAFSAVNSPIAAGTTWYFQFLYGDTAAAGCNLTEGLGISFKP